MGPRVSILTVGEKEKERTKVGRERKRHKGRCMNIAVTD